MPLSPFQQICSVLHLNDISNINTLNDLLHKIRPLSNILKNTLGVHLGIGMDVALDEATMASKSAYGQEFIVYNLMMNTGKYHFKVYLLYCLCTFASIRLHMHTKDTCDITDGQSKELDGHGVDCQSEDNEDNEDNVQQVSKLNSIILDMWKLLENKVLIIKHGELLHKPYHCSTVWYNQRMYLKSIQFTKAEARNLDHGSVHFAVNKQFRITSFGWFDGSPLHMLSSTADDRYGCCAEEGR